MFTDFKSVWTPILLSRALKNKPVMCELAGEPILLTRRKHTVFARTRDTFTPIPTYEGGGLVWLHTSALERGIQPAPPDVPNALLAFHPMLFSLEVTWQTHWTRVLENMMDNAHLTFVHRRTLGWRLQRAKTPHSVLDVQCEPRERGFFVTGMLDSKMYSGLHHFLPPNGVVIYMDGPKGKRRAHIYCIPVHAKATRLMIVSNFGMWNAVARIFLPLNRYIVQEDRAIVESSHPPEVPPPGLEQSVRTDKGTLRFRKYYYDTLKEPRLSHSRSDNQQAASSDRLQA